MGEPGLAGRGARARAVRRHGGPRRHAANRGPVPRRRGRAPAVRCVSPSTSPGPRASRPCGSRSPTLSARRRRIPNRVRWSKFCCAGVLGFERAALDQPALIELVQDHFNPLHARVTVDVERTLGAGVRVRQRIAGPDRAGRRPRVCWPKTRRWPPPPTRWPSAPSSSSARSSKGRTRKPSRRSSRRRCPDMLIHRVELANFKSFTAAAVDMAPGLTAIVGDNGAGKTAILQAIGLGMFDVRPRPPRERDATWRDGRVGGDRVHLRAGRAALPHHAQAAPHPGPAETERCRRTRPWTRRSLDVEQGRVFEERADDVEAFLAQHLGVAGFTGPDEVFDRVVGVPQGRLTRGFPGPAAPAPRALRPHPARRRVQARPWMTLPPVAQPFRQAARRP